MWILPRQPQHKPTDAERLYVLVCRPRHQHFVTKITDRFGSRRRQSYIAPPAGHGGRQPAVPGLPRTCNQTEGGAHNTNSDLRRQYPATGWQRRTPGLPARLSHRKAADLLPARRSTRAGPACARGNRANTRTWSRADSGTQSRYRPPRRDQQRSSRREDRRPSRFAEHSPPEAASPMTQIGALHGRTSAAGKNARIRIPHGTMAQRPIGWAHHRQRPRPPQCRTSRSCPKRCSASAIRRSGRGEGAVPAEPSWPARCPRRARRATACRLHPQWTLVSVFR